ncbi:MAG: hypothetical protein DF168_01089 [Candidatus Moanabacter tarae]|uniref:Lipopolysaccharide export system permease protein LptG n=1 Tax=Candidatus Moanibacter tarae TaxID=2200854 RepID=A0A2Z4AQ15_9BACT|nr:MAG: hypothetical protein DF168_01089 [Candidatus Moanabacter tarae]
MKIDGYIFFEWIRWFALALAATLGILILENIYNDLPDLLKMGIRGQDILRYYIVLLPSFIPTVLPVSLLISVLLGLGNLYQHNEITAFKSVGLSLWRISRVFWAIGIFLSIVLFYLNAQLVPSSIEKAGAMRDDFARYSHGLEGVESEFGIIYNLTFYNHLERRLWFMNRFNEYENRGYGITVSELSETGREEFRIVANEVHYEWEGKRWIFYEGRIIEFDVETGEALRSLPIIQRSYSEFEENPVLMRSLEKRPKDLSLFQLHHVLKYLGAVDDPRFPAYKVRYHSILANPFSVIIVIALAIPFVVSGVRVSPVVGVAKTVGLFFAYYLVANVSTLMGERGILDPISAGWLPNSIMGLTAFWFNRRQM